MAIDVDLVIEEYGVQGREGLPAKGLEALCCMPLLSTGGHTGN